MKTRFTLITILILLMTFSDLKAQETKLGGIRAGWQNSVLASSGKVDDNVDPLSAFYVGLFRENKIIPLLAIGTGLEYSQMGVKDKTLDDTQIRLHYLCIPIDLRVKVGPVFAKAGFSANFRVGEKVTVLGTDITDTELWTKSEVFDIPFYLGAGVDILIFRIEARYHWGLLDVYKQTADNNAQQLQYFQLGVGVMF